MSTNVIPFDPAALAAALKKTSREATTTAAFIKMEKSGAWVFGINAEEVAEDDEFFVHPQGFVHGYVAWEADNGGTKLGEIMGPVTEVIPPTGPVPEGADGWQFQLGLGFVSVADRTPMLYRATSVGGKRAIATLASEVGTKLAIGDPAYVPVVTLSSESYKHKKYGKIYNPLVTITRWVTMAELMGEESKPAAKKLAAPAKAPAKKRV